MPPWHAPACRYARIDLVFLQALTSAAATFTPRRGPELSDVALFVVAAVAVWFTRRALRNRNRNRNRKG